MNITCSSILEKIQFLEEKYFVVKETKVFKEWIISKNSYHLCFYKYKSGFPFGKQHL